MGRWPWFGVGALVWGWGPGPGLARGWFPADVVGRDVLWARMFLCGEASCAQRNILRVGEHFVHRVTDCAEGNQSRSLSAQNVPLCTKCSVTCDRPWPAGGDGAGHGAGAGFVRPPGLPVGYLGRTCRQQGTARLAQATRPGDPGRTRRHGGRGHWRWRGRKGRPPHTQTENGGWSGAPPAGSA